MRQPQGMTMRESHSYRLFIAFVFTISAAALAQDQPQPPPGKASSRPKVEFGDLPKDEKAEAKLLKIAGAGFKLRYTPHYVIAYNTDEPTIKSFVTRVEATYKAVVRFAANLGLTIAQPEKKLQIFFFNEFDGYEKYSKKQGFPATQQAPG